MVLLQLLVETSQAHKNLDSNTGLISGTSANLGGFSSEDSLSENSSLPVENIDVEADSTFKEAPDEDL